MLNLRGNSAHPVGCCCTLLSQDDFKVEPYPIPRSFLKLEYLKTELNVDNGTYAIV